MTDTSSESEAKRQSSFRHPVWAWLALWMMVVVGTSVEPFRLDLGLDGIGKTTMTEAVKTMG